MTDLPAPPRFDESRGAWVLTRHDDVSAALRHPALVMPGTPALGADVHRDVHDATVQRWSEAQLARLCGALGEGVSRRTAALADGGEHDLVASVAAPCARALATAAAGVPPDADDACHALARTVFLAASRSTDGTVAAGAQAASVRLGQLLATAEGRAVRPPDVQAFVALSQTLPVTLAAAWRLLLRDPDARRAWRLSPSPRGGAVHELLRLASPARAVFRVAARELPVGDAHVRRGDRLVLMLHAANRDPARFPHPDRFDAARAGGGQLGLGAGAHRCAGASFVQLAVSAATAALLQGDTDVVLAPGAEPCLSWVGGFAIRGPGTLPVVARRARRTATPAAAAGHHP